MRLRVDFTVNLANLPGFRPPTGTDAIRAAIRYLAAAVDADPRGACKRAYTLLYADDVGGDGY